MSIKLLTVPSIPLVQAGDDLAALIAAGVKYGRIVVHAGDVFVVAQKIVSKAEGRTVDLKTVAVSARARQIAQQVDKDPRIIELVLREAAEILLMKPNLLLVEHKLGFVMPNAGIDQSNVGDDLALLLPADPDRSAEMLRQQLTNKFHVRCAVIINDSVSRPWRAGTCGIAIGAAGLPVLHDLRGQPDLLGRKLKSTITGYADEIASAASLLMGQAAEGLPVVIVRGLTRIGHGAVVEMLSPPSAAPDYVVRI